MSKTQRTDRASLNHDPSLLYNAVCDGYDVGLHLAWFPGINVTLKKYGGSFIGKRTSRWYRFWRFSLDDLNGVAREMFDELIDAGQPHGIEEDWCVFSEMLEHVQANPEPAAFLSELRGTIYPMKDGASAVAFSDYHDGVIRVCRMMKGRYFRGVKAWCFTDVSPAMLVSNLLDALPLQEHQIEVMPGEYDILEDGMLKPKPKDAVTLNMENCAMVSRGEGSEEKSENGIVLAVTAPLTPTSFVGKDFKTILAGYPLYRPYQFDGVVHLLCRTSALLADDMGLGKTRQAVCAGQVLLSFGGNPNQKALVACPASLAINWKIEIEMVAPHARVSTFKWDPAANWIVTSYDQLGALLPYAGNFKVMFTDEAHLLKEPSALRTRTAFDMAAAIPYRYLLTGTPILNRESEIHTLLRLSGHPLGELSVKEFTAEFGGNAEFRRELNKRISEWMLRRMKAKVLKLPGKEQQLLHVALPPQVMATYNTIANDRQLTALMKIQRLRLLLETAKIQHVITEMVAELAAVDKVIIFCEFKQSVQLVVDSLQTLGIESVTLTGDDSPRKRQRAVDSFQKDPNIGAFVGTTLAAGVGITLTAANYVFFASLPWTSALYNQGGDRAYRNGQKRTVFIKVPLVEETIDMKLWDMLCFKHTIATDIVSVEGEQRAMEAFTVQWQSTQRAEDSAGSPLPVAV